MKCNYCNYEVRDTALYCPNCGEDPKTTKKKEIKKVTKKEEKEKPISTSSSSVSWGLISFFIPLIGIILFCIWNKTRPKDAKAAGIGALARFMLFIFYILLMVIVGISSN